MAALFVMVFSVPASLGDTGKIVWVAACYAGVVAVFFTASNVAYSALLSVMTPDPGARITLSSFRFIAALLTILAASSATLPVVKSLGGDQQAWTTIATVYAVAMVVTMIIVFVGTKERVRPEGERSSLNQPAKVLFATVVRNKYFYVVAGLFVCFFTFNGITQATGVYYSAEVLGDSSLFGLLSIASTVPILLGIPLMPWLFRKIGKRRAFLVGTLVMLAGSAVPLLAVDSLPIVLAGHVLRGAGSVPFAVGLFAVVADVVDFGELRFGVRADGITYSAVTIGIKAGAGIGAGVTGWILASGGYVAGATSQPQSATQAILALYFYLPMLLLLVIGILSWLFTVERYAGEIAALTQADTEEPTPMTQPA